MRTKRPLLEHLSFLTSLQKPNNAIIFQQYSLAIQTTFSCVADCKAGKGGQNALERATYATNTPNISLPIARDE